MCLTILSNKETAKEIINETKQTATEDLVVYKVVDGRKKWKNQYGEGYNEFKSIHQFFTYKLGYHYYRTGKNKFTYWFSSTSGFLCRTTSNKFKLEIHAGLHAYVRFDKIVVTRKWSTDRIIIKCIIPKGSKYFIGNNNDVVTDNLIIDSVVKVIPKY